ncbi:MAG: carbamoyltransferase HypF, partial [Hydrogenophaga sp.]|nr:carbamoyltransferase HypF [Hydrogenophaga sp.]
MNTAPLPTVLACGAWLKNAACLLVDGAPVWSAVHGDLSDPAACAALEASVETLLADHCAPIAAVAHDLHPDVFSTQLAVQLAAALGVPAIGVQHHHAHIAAVVAEQEIEGPVIGLALDGVGL